MILKMKFLSITGPKADIDRVVEKYLSRYEIHLENALAELKTVQTLTPYIEINPYKEALQKAEEYVSMLPAGKKPSAKPMTIEEALNTVNQTDVPFVKNQNEREALRNDRKTYEEQMTTLESFQSLPVRFEDMMNYHFIHYRFGRIAREFFTKFENYIYENSDSVFYQCYSNSQYVYGVYFTPKNNHQKVDAVYASLHFERIYMSDTFRGTPQEEYRNAQAAIRRIDEGIEKCSREMQSLLEKEAGTILEARDLLKSYSSHFDVRKMAALTKSKSQTFYILCGWMSEKDAAAFQEDIKDETEIFCMVEDDDANIDSQPPTKLENPRFFKPFEMFVRMYGLPGYHEFDPTIYLTLTYAFIFGIMFGDFGQGLCLLIGGFLLYKWKGKPLAAIIGTAGIFSTIFGLIYNSFFGFEEFLPYDALIHPKDDMVRLPGLGNINTVFVLAIAFGMFMILFDIVLAIINAVKQKDVENTWFSQNAVAGLVFYGSIVAMVFLIMTGHGSMGTVLKILVVLAVLGLIGIFLKEMLARMVQHRKPFIEGGKGMYFVQAFFETFETLLSYLSNTLSYVRIGAYAVSHVAMMQVVMLLATGSGSSPNLVGVILGNVFVMLMEGLMVGIQVLRLEYYEMFSRFYKGDGREFKPFIRKAGQN